MARAPQVRLVMSKPMVAPVRIILQFMVQDLEKVVGSLVAAGAAKMPHSLEYTVTEDKAGAVTEVKIIV